MLLAVTELQIVPSGETKLAHLKLLHQDLGRLRSTSKWDGFLCYLYGLVLRKMDLPHSLQVLQDSVNLNPLNWAAWLELANLVKNSEMVRVCRLPVVFNMSITSLYSIFAAQSTEIT